MSAQSDDDGRDLEVGADIDVGVQMRGDGFASVPRDLVRAGLFPGSLPLSNHRANRVLPTALAVDADSEDRDMPSGVRRPVVAVDGLPSGWLQGIQNQADALMMTQKQSPLVKALTKAITALMDPPSCNALLVSDVAS